MCAQAIARHLYVKKYVCTLVHTHTHTHTHTHKTPPRNAWKETYMHTLDVFEGETAQKMTSKNSLLKMAEQRVAIVVPASQSTARIRLYQPSSFVESS